MKDIQRDIKILFSDLDGTLVEHAGDVTQESILSAQKLNRHGIDLVLVSGRHPDIMKSIHANLGLTTPVIGCNGGIIKDMNTQEVIFINELSKEVVRQAFHMAHQLELDWVVYEKNHIFFENMPPKSYKMPYTNSFLPKELQANFVHLKHWEDIFKEEYVFVKILLLCDNNMKMLDKALELLQITKNVEIVLSANSYIDVMSEGSSKGKAIQRLMQIRNMNLQNTASIGDAQNDLDMIELAGLGIAMGNGIPVVKNAAKYITTPFPNGFPDAVNYILQTKTSIL